MREMSVAEQRYRAVLAVISDGRTVKEVAADWSVSRQRCAYLAVPLRGRGSGGAGGPVAKVVDRACNAGWLGGDEGVCGVDFDDCHQRSFLRERGEVAPESPAVRMLEPGHFTADHASCQRATGGDGIDGKGCAGHVAVPGDDVCIPEQREDLAGRAFPGLSAACGEQSREPRWELAGSDFA
jgi:hypothetical protein